MEQHPVKVVVVGSASCGKTCLINRYTTGEFMENVTSTIGVDYCSKRIEVEGNACSLNLWDTAGQERFRSVSRSIYHGARGVCVVYDITREPSYKDVPGWLSDVRSIVDPSTPIFLIGNKSDLEDKRAVKTQDADVFAKENGLCFFETSAKENTNVEKAFEFLVKTILEKAKQEEMLAQQGGVSSSSTSAAGGAMRVSNPSSASGSEGKKVDLNKPSNSSSGGGGGGKCVKC